MGSVRQSEERNRRGIDKRGKGKDLYDDTQEDGRVERRNGIRKVREAKTRGRSSKGAERARDQVVQAHRYRQILKPGSQGAFCRPSVLTSDESCREAQQCLCIVRAGDICVSMRVCGVHVCVRMRTTC